MLKRTISFEPRAGFLVVPALMLLLSSPADAIQIGQGYFSPGASLINFDNLSGGGSITTGEIVTTQFSGMGVLFNDPDYLARANYNLSQVMLTGHSLPNTLFVTQHDGTQGRPLQILFSTPQQAVGLFFATSLSADIELTAYGAGGVVLEHDTAFGVNLYGDLSQGFTGIARTEGIVRLDVESHPTLQPTAAFNFQIDDLTFQVPEPSIAALVGLGSVALIIVRRRR